MKKLFLFIVVLSFSISAYAGGIDQKLIKAANDGDKESQFDLGMITT